MKHFPASHAPARLAGIQDSLTQSPGKPVATIVLRRSTALLALAVAIAASLFIGAYAFGSALVRQHDPAPFSELPPSNFAK